MSSALPEDIFNIIQSNGAPVAGYKNVTKLRKDPFNLDTLQQEINTEKIIFKYSLKTFIRTVKGNVNINAKLIDQLAMLVYKSKQKLSQLIVIQTIYNSMGDEKETFAGGRRGKGNKTRKSGGGKSKRTKRSNRGVITRKNSARASHSHPFFSAFNIKLLLFLLLCFVANIPAMVSGAEVQPIVYTERHIQLMVGDTTMKRSPPMPAIAFTEPSAQPAQGQAQIEQYPGWAPPMRTMEGQQAVALTENKGFTNTEIVSFVKGVMSWFEEPEIPLKDTLEPIIFSINNYNQDAYMEIRTIIGEVVSNLDTSGILPRATFTNATLTKRLGNLNKELAEETAALAAEVAKNKLNAPAEESMWSSFNPLGKTVTANELKLTKQVSEMRTALEAAKPLTAPINTRRSLASISADIAEINTEIARPQYKKLLADILKPDTFLLNFDGNSLDLRTTYTADQTNIYTVITTIRELLLREKGTHAPKTIESNSVEVLMHDLEIIQKLKFLEYSHTEFLIEKFEGILSRTASQAKYNMAPEGITGLIKNLEKEENKFLKTIREKISGMGAKGMSRDREDALSVQANAIAATEQQIALNVKARTAEWLSKEVATNAMASVDMAGMLKDAVGRSVKNILQDTTTAGLNIVDEATGRAADVLSRRMVDADRLANQTINVAQTVSRGTGELVPEFINGVVDNLSWKAWAVLSVAFLITMQTIGFGFLVRKAGTAIVGSVKFVWAIGYNGTVWIWQKVRGGNMVLHSIHDEVPPPIPSRVGRQTLFSAPPPLTQMGGPPALTQMGTQMGGPPPLTQFGTQMRSRRTIEEEVPELLGPYPDLINVTPGVCIPVPGNNYCANSSYGGGRKKRTSRKRANKRKHHRPTKKRHVHRKRKY